MLLCRHEDNPTYLLGCDVGGTFTDLVLIRIQDSHIVARHKLRSTPEDPGIAIDKGFTEICQVPLSCLSHPQPTDSCFMQLCSPTLTDTATLTATAFVGCRHRQRPSVIAAAWHNYRH